MESKTYPLAGVRRLTAFPYPLETVGLMTDHFQVFRAHVLTSAFLCFSFNAGKYNPPPREYATRCSILLPGARLDQTVPCRHDELFFCYSPEVSESLRHVFRLNGNSLRFPFDADAEFHNGLASVRELAEARLVPGNADRLDVLALQMVFSALAARAAGKSVRHEGSMRMQEIASELKHGKPLAKLIPAFGFSRRAFYYEWNRTFAVSPKRMVLDFRIGQALDLLVRTDLPAEKIARRCGFSSGTVFFNCFRKKMQCTPGEYRKRERGNGISFPFH